MKAPRKCTISIKVTATEARHLRAAARLSGTTLSRFVVQSAIEKAGELRDETVLYFSAEDAAMFIDKLEHPSPPNARLAEAVRLYREELGLPEDEH